MKSWIKHLSFFSLFILLTSCSEKKPPIFSGMAMTVPYRITLGVSISESERERVRELIAKAFDQIDQSCNNWNPQSEISRFNRAKVNEPFAISPHLMRLIQLVDRVYEQTQGRFDPTVGALCTLWKEALKKGELPSIQELEHLRASVGWHRIHHDDAFLYKACDAITIDLCAIAKGYAVDLISEALLEAGYSDYCIDWGGEIRTQGHTLFKRSWNIAIARSDLVLSGDLAIATSGNYLQKWQVENACYTHIINPKTGAALRVTENSVASATVASDSCAYSDALATALMVFENKEEAMIWSQKFTSESASPVHIWIAKIEI